MTEAEWLAGADPGPMLESLRGRASSRKLRLFSCACCRRSGGILADERSRRAVDAAEAFADGQVTSAVLAAAHSADQEQWDEAERAWDKADPGRMEVEWFGPVVRAAEAAVVTSAPGRHDAVAADRVALNSCTSAPELVADWREGEMAVRADLLRCVTGNPFRTVPFDPHWLSFLVTTLAQTMYESRDFSPMPILADALEEAGCDNAAVLAHCRGNEPHLRGCWVVDLVLKKE
jgi:hypothetical protein